MSLQIPFRTSTAGSLVGLLCEGHAERMAVIMGRITDERDRGREGEREGEREHDQASKENVWVLPWTDLKPEMQLSLTFSTFRLCEHHKQNIATHHHGFHAHGADKQLHHIAKYCICDRDFLFIQPAVDLVSPQSCTRPTTEFCLITFSSENTIGRERACRSEQASSKIWLVPRAYWSE